MFDPTICTEETRIEGVKGEIARSLHHQLEVVCLQVRQHDDRSDPLYIGGRELPLRDVLTHIDSWADGWQWQFPRFRTMAIAEEALEPKNFEAELTSYAESGL